MFEKMFKYWTAMFGRSCLIQIAATAFVVPLACVLIFVPLYIVQNTRLDRTTETLLLAGSGVLFLLVTIGGSMAFALWTVARRRSQLDAAFIPLGLTGSTYLLNGRQYHGQFAGRAADVYFYRGPTLDIYLAAPVLTRLGIGPKSQVGRAVAGMLNRQPMAVDEPGLQPFNIYAHDEAWARALLADSTAREALLKLMADASGYEIRQVHAQPDAWLFRLYHTYTNRITADNLRRWLEGLAALARAAEGMPAPTQTAETSALERNMRSNRNVVNRRVMLITVGAFVGLAVCFALALVPVFILVLNESPR